MDSLRSFNVFVLCSSILCATVMRSTMSLEMCRVRHSRELMEVSNESLELFQVKLRDGLPTTEHQAPMTHNKV